MTHRTSFRLAATALLLACAVVSAQPGVQPQSPPRQGGSLVVPPPTPQYDALVKRGPDNRIIPIDGSLDAIALARNPMFDAAARERMKPAVAEWTADLNQIVVDNVDFLERIRDGFFDSFDPSNVQQAQYLQHITVQLSAAGPLSARLSQQNPTLGGAFSLNMRMTNEYIQAMFAEIQSSPTPPEKAGEPDVTRQQRNSTNVSRFFQALALRDAFEQYRRILIDAAPLMDQALGSLPESARSKAQAKTAPVKAASDDLARLVAVNDLVNQLSFDDKRAFLAKAVALGAGPDPFHPAPPFPPSSKPAAAGTPEPASAPKPGPH